VPKPSWFGLVVPIPTFSELSIVIAVDVALSSIPVEVKPVSVPTLVMFVWAAVDKVPAKVLPVTVPVVVIAEEPTSILPKPDVIEPPSNAPTLVILVCAAVDKVPAKVVPVTVPVVVMLPDPASNAATVVVPLKFRSVKASVTAAPAPAPSV
jgi:hypothetical protein